MREAYGGPPKVVEGPRESAEPAASTQIEGTFFDPV
jgi:hypothetical protein